MDRIIGNKIRAILYRQGTQIDLDGKSTQRIRIRRSGIPKLLTQLWEKIEGASLRTRRVRPHSGKVASLKTSTQSVPHNFNIGRTEITKKNGDLNKEAIQNYVKNHQRSYLSSVPDWKNISKKDRNDADLLNTLQSRTQVIAMWLASHNGSLPGEHLSLNDIQGNWKDCSKTELTPDLLNEATNIALRSMENADMYTHNIDPDVQHPNTVLTRIFPEYEESATEDYPVHKEAKFKAKYFDFDNANQKERGIMMRQWSSILNEESNGD